jgi:hypothetical protein
MQNLQMCPRVGDPCFKLYFTEVVCDGVDRIALARVRVQILALEYNDEFKVMLKAGNVLSTW